MKRENSQDTRRRFLKSGAGLVAAGGSLLAQQPANGIPPAPAGSFLNAGDNAILRFSLAAEILAADIWSQLADSVANDQSISGGISGQDGLMLQVIRDIARDEQSHAAFLSAYAAKAGQDPLTFEPFRTLPSYAPVGSGTAGRVFAGTAIVTSNLPALRLANLTNLNIDTSFYYKYRSSLNPDADPGQIYPTTFSQIVNLSGQPAIGGNYQQNSQTAPNRLYTPQAIGEALLLFGSAIEQQEGSTYLALGQNITNPELALAMMSIMPVEMMHYTALQASLVRNIASANNCAAGGITPAGGGAGGAGIGGSSFAACYPATQPGTGQNNQTNVNVAPQPQNYQAANGGFSFYNLAGAAAPPESILPAPADFKAGLPPVSIVRPGNIPSAGATVAVQAMMRMNLFQGQPPAFTNMLLSLAQAADSAMRMCGANNQGTGVAG